MKVRNVMSTTTINATPENTLTDVALVMRDKDTGAVPVLHDGKLVGIVTDRDIVTRAIAEKRDPLSTSVQEILTEQPEFVGPDDDIEEVADLMSDRQIRRLPVVEQGRLVGMVSLGDIAVKHEEKQTAARALESISKGVKAGAVFSRREAPQTTASTKTTPATKKQDARVATARKAKHRKAA